MLGMLVFPFENEATCAASCFLVPNALNIDMLLS